MKSFIEEIGEDYADQLIAEGVRKATQKAKEMGLPLTLEIDGEICRKYPDGTTEPVKDIALPHNGEENKAIA